MPITKLRIRGFEVDHEEISRLGRCLNVHLLETFFRNETDVVIPNDIIDRDVVVQFEQDEVVHVTNNGLGNLFVILSH